MIIRRIPLHLLRLVYMFFLQRRLLPQHCIGIFWQFYHRKGPLRTPHMMDYQNIDKLYEMCHILRSHRILQDIVECTVLFRWHPLCIQIRPCRYLKKDWIYNICIMYIDAYNMSSLNYVCVSILYTLPWSPHEHAAARIPFLKQRGAAFFE